MYQSGLDTIESEEYILPKSRGGLITNMSAVSRKNNYSFDILPSKSNIVKLFTPEHGLFGVEEAGASVTDSYYNNIPVISLYGEKKAPSGEDLEDIDYLVFDIQDVGLRIYTYLYTLSFSMEAAGKRGIPFYLLDRPNPLNGLTIEGNILKKGFHSFVGMYPIPQRYALTIGEFARFVRAEEKLNVDLEIIPLKGWLREKYLDEYSNNFNHTSPNLPSFESILAYAATVILEGTNISEGRGTTMPFLIFGAPWMDGDKLLRSLREDNFPGIEWKKIQFVPKNSKYSGKICHGARIYITDRKCYSPVYTGFRLLQIIRNMFPDDFKWQPPFKDGQKPFIEYLTGDDFIYSIINPDELKEILESGTVEFTSAVKDFKLYD